MFNKSKKSWFEITESTGISESEKAPIENAKSFDELVLSIESMNQLVIRDDREAALTVWKKSEKADIFGKTLEFPMMDSTDFYELLDKFNSMKPRAAEVSSIELIEETQSEDSPVSETDSVESTKQPDEGSDSEGENPSVHETIDESESETDLASDTQRQLEEKEAEIVALKAQMAERVPVSDSIALTKEPWTNIEEGSADTESTSDSETTEPVDHVDPEGEYKGLGGEHGVMLNPKTKARINIMDLPQSNIHSCGFENASHAKFCSGCGQMIEQEVKTEPVQEMIPIDSEAQESHLDKVDSSLPKDVDIFQVLSLKDGWNVRPEIERSIALKYANMKDGRLREVETRVQDQKEFELEAKRQEFAQETEAIETGYVEKMEVAKQMELQLLEQEQQEEVEKVVNERKSILTQMFNTAMAKLEGKKAPKPAEM